MYLGLNQGGTVAESQASKWQILFLINICFLKMKNDHLKQA